MASIQKRGKKWVAEVRVKGNYASKSCDTKIEAHNWAIEKEHEFGKAGALVRGRTVGDAFERYKREVSIKKRGERWESVRLGKLSRHDMALIALCDLTADDLGRWRDESLKTLKASSVNREMNLIASVLEIARKEWKWIATNPIRDVDRPKNPKPRDRRYSEKEIDRILKGIGYKEGNPVNQRQEVGVAFLLALETAMRQGEIFGLDWSDVDLSARYLTLTNTKNGSTRQVPLSLKAMELLRSLGQREEGRVFKSPQQSAGQIFRGAVKIAGIKNLTFHDTRHEAITRLARKLDVLDLARMIGHRDPRSLMIYYNATASEIAGRLD